MKIKNRDLLDGIDVLMKVFAYPQEDFKKAYAMSKRSRVVRSEFEDLNQARQALIRKYGIMKNGEYEMIGRDIKLDNPDKFREEYKTFADTELDLDMWAIPFNDISEMKEFEQTKDEKEKVKTNRPLINPAELDLLIPFLAELPEDK